MVDGNGPARVSAASSVMLDRVRLQPELIAIRLSTLVRRPFADHSTIRRRAAYMDLQDAAIFQREIQYLSVLGVWG